MLQYLFPRFMGQYKEGGFIVGKFKVSNSGATLTPVAGDSHQLLTAAGDTGAYVVTLKGGAKKITVVGLHASLPDEDDPTDARNVFVNEEDGIDAAAGTIPVVAIKLGTDTAGTTGSPAVGDLVDSSILTICLYVDK